MSEKKRWDGKGKPPSYQAALEWAERQGLTKAQAALFIPPGEPMSRTGERAREAVEKIENAPREGSLYSRLTSGLPNINQLPNINPLSRGDDLGPGGGGKNPQPSPKDPSAYDTDRSGDLSAGEIAGAVSEGVVGDELAALLEGEIGGDTSRGAPLWPYEVSPEIAEGIKVTNQQPMSKYIRRGVAGDARHKNMVEDDREIGARYFEKNTLDPLRWSAEARADLQRLMHQIGLYGDSKTTLGSWSSIDQKVYAEVLAHANVEGMGWLPLLQKWKREPPEALLDQINGGAGGGRAPIQVTNPLDIQQAAKATSQDLIGAVDRGFVESVVPGYQSVEVGAGNAYANADDGAAVVAPPSVAAFAEDKLRRDNPIEVDGYQFLNQFQSFMQMLGVQ